jgi:hypothetical protein
MCEGSGSIDDEAEARNDFEDYDGDKVICAVRNLGDQVAGDEGPSDTPGTYPRQCLTDLDCDSIDGTAGVCQCGMDGRAYCRAKFGSSVFNEYWEYCVEDDNEVNYWRRAYW